MMALLLRLALRAGEAAGLLPGDIAWRQGIVTVRGKGNRAGQVPLPADVGGPLARYLRDGRPAGTAHRQVFLALDAPHAPVGPTAVASIAGRALRGAGISGNGAAHLLRHTAADLDPGQVRVIPAARPRHRAPPHLLLVPARQLPVIVTSGIIPVAGRLRAVPLRLPPEHHLLQDREGLVHLG